MKNSAPLVGKISWIVGVGIIFLLSQCQPDGLFKGKADMPEEGWPLTRKPVFTFDIPENAPPHEFSYIIRNSIQYPYYNLFIRYTLRNEKKEVIQSKLEELILFNAKTGKPNGDGLGDIFDHTIISKSLNSRLPLPAGKYSLELEQFMRQDTLAGIMTIGISLETPRVSP